MTRAVSIPTSASTGELKFEHSFQDDWSLQVRAYYDRYRLDGLYPDNNSAPEPGPTVINRELDVAQWFGGEVMVSKTLWQHQRLTLGGEFRDDFQLNMANYDVDPAYTYLDSHRSAWSFAFYGEDEITFLTNLVLNAGVRYDWFSAFGDTVNPRGALIYNPWHESTFKLIYGQAFRAPNAYERYYLAGGTEPNPDLRPESIRSWELVYEQGLPASLRLGATLFYEQIEDLIGQRLDPANGNIYYANIDQVESRGFETELEGRWKGGWCTRLSYTFTDAYNTQTGSALNNSPRHLGKANVTVPLWRDKIFAGLELQAMSSRKTVQGNEVGPVAVVNATLYSRELIRNLEFSASLYNLFDKKYGDPLSADYKQDTMPQDGRTFRLKLTYHF